MYQGYSKIHWLCPWRFRKSRGNFKNIWFHRVREHKGFQRQGIRDCNASLERQPNSR